MGSFHVVFIAKFPKTFVYLLCIEPEAIKRAFQNRKVIARFFNKMTDRSWAHM